MQIKRQGLSQTSSVRRVVRNYVTRYLLLKEFKDTWKQTDYSLFYIETSEGFSKCENPKRRDARQKNSDESA
jgi:hypothetical protein